VSAWRYRDCESDADPRACVPHRILGCGSMRALVLVLRDSLEGRGSGDDCHGAESAFDAEDRLRPGLRQGRSSKAKKLNYRWREEHGLRLGQ
jgi:hypothetical protein